MANVLYAVLAVLALASTTNRRVPATDTTTPSTANRRVTARDTTTPSTANRRVTARDTTIPSTTNRRVPATATTTPSLVDAINQELPYMYCNYKYTYNEKQCNTDKALLQAALVVDSGVCSLAKVYVGCLDDNCYKTTALSDSIQRVRDRCNGARPLQATGMIVLLMLAVHLLKV